MKKSFQVGLRLPENLYYFFDAEAKKTDENIASVVRKKLVKSVQENAEKARFEALEKQMQNLEKVLQEQLKCA